VIIFGAALAAGAWGAPFFSALQRRWRKHGVVRKGIGQLSSPIHHARLPRRRRVRRSPPHIAQ
jgi:hypothetical protein